jgi:predicted dehydrogenase
MAKKKINIAIIGLGFGAEFIPIYQKHPGVVMYAICQRNKENLDKVGDAFNIEKRYTDYDELLKDPNVRCRAHKYSYS